MLCGYQPIAAELLHRREIAIRNVMRDFVPKHKLLHQRVVVVEACIDARILNFLFQIVSAHEVVVVCVTSLETER